MLSKILIEKQKLTHQDINVLDCLHLLKDYLFNESLNSLNSIEEYNQKMINLESAMQYMWKFDTNPKYHTHWFLDPKCTCSKQDNMDRQGTGYYIVNQSCPLHGD